MVVVRLSRGGKKKCPFFSMVVADSRNRRDGRFIERVGFYTPVPNAEFGGLKVDVARIDYWVSKGAQLSPTVLRLVQQFKQQAAVQV